jgi:enamine deaminase RidA (YjgF/YER057c/UK114 family)
MADAAICAGNQDCFLCDLHTISFLDSRLFFAAPFLTLYWVKPAGRSKFIGSARFFWVASRGHVSGHASLDLTTGEVIRGTIQEETNETLTSIGKVIREAGCTFDDIVKYTCFLLALKTLMGLS